MRRTAITLGIVLAASAVLFVGARSFLVPAEALRDQTPALRPDPEKPGVLFVRPDLQATVRTVAVISGGDGIPCVPTAAVLHAADRPTVLVRGSPATVEPRVVHLGARHEAQGMVDVTDGLASGDRVAIPTAEVTLP